MENNILDEEDKSSIGYHLSEILKKYGLEEEEEKSFEKLEKDEPLNGEFIGEICSNLAKNLISEKDAILSIQKKFNITEGTSKEILNDIKNIILPQLKEIIVKRYNSSANKNVPDTNQEVDIFPKIKTPIGVEEALARPQTQASQVPNRISNVISEEPLTKIELAKKRLKKENILESEKPAMKKSTKSDTYREPIA
jgi:hypothetical protein